MTSCTKKRQFNFQGREGLCFKKKNYVDKFYMAKNSTNIQCRIIRLRT